MGFSDIIQPGLIQLQPSFDDYMDTLPSLSGLSGMYAVSLLLSCVCVNVTAVTQRYVRCFTASVSCVCKCHRSDSAVCTLLHCFCLVCVNVTAVHQSTVWCHPLFGISLGKLESGNSVNWGNWNMVGEVWRNLTESYRNV